MHSNLHMENLKAKCHVRDLDLNVLHIGIPFDCDFYLHTTPVSCSLGLKGTELLL